MSLVNVETGELFEPLTEDAARRLTERIRIAATNYTEAKEKVLALVDEAKAGAAHIALGYKSWSAYLSDVLSDEPLRLARDERRELVTRLADEGMSTRAIAPIVGATKSAVDRDLQLSHAGTVAPRQTEGLDGRVRTMTAAAGQMRGVQRDKAETYLNLIEMQAARAAREVQNLTPDQLRRVRPKADLWTVGLRNSIEVLQHLVDSLDPEGHK